MCSLYLFRMYQNSKLCGALEYNHALYLATFNVSILETAKLVIKRIRNCEHTIGYYL